ncbi:hypothetical protein BBD41_19775 [Paenibacillus ihbetae]|uniref:Uncharacterized protein n=1 Tax=Paenibacillus ihbetae TaxID=1870820 RepID=A0A1B2E3T3_9BACL|nr:hypothetical protein [Paenibacillus ihbetae]ANY74623.1 hypothetical protein BBD41_19775 [Paenibacillus ihbetae]
MKKIFILTTIVLLIIAGLLITYHNVPLSADTIIKYKNKIEKVYISNYIDKEGITPIDLDVSDPEKISEIIDIFDQVKFTHSNGSKNIKNDTRYMSLYIFYDKNGSLDDYTLEINEKGELLVDRHKYKIKNNASVVFERLYSIVGNLSNEHKRP